MNQNMEPEENPINEILSFIQKLYPEENRINEILSFIQKLYPFVQNMVQTLRSSPYVSRQVALLKDFERDFQEIKCELEHIQALLNEADAKACDGEVKTRMKQLRVASFRIQDVIDEYNMYMAQGLVNDNHSGVKALIQKVFQMALNLKSRYQIAREIHGIKRSLPDNFQRESGSGSSIGTKTARFSDPQMSTFSFKESQVVGFESGRNELVRCLLEETNELKLVSVVGRPAVGKTTLIQYVLENPQVKNPFDCYFCISASQFNTAKELLIYMINKFFEHSKESIPNGLDQMDQMELATRVSDYLQPKRYLLWFDDVKEKDFSKGIEDAMAKNDKGSRIIVTTRNTVAAECFKDHFSVQIHELQPLPIDKALELFNKKAFRGACPTDLKELSEEIVQQCERLPPAIVAIGGLLSKKPKTIFVWDKFSQNLVMELAANTCLSSLSTILSLSYDELPSYLKPCMLYFGIYPVQHKINCKRLIGQLIAEEFVKCDKGRILEDVAEEYLQELIEIGLVQVSSVGFDGKVKSCRVDIFLHQILIGKMKDQSFCHRMYDDHEQVTVDITRRFSIITFSNDVLRSKSNPRILAIFVFNKEELPEYFIDSLSIGFKHIKVLNFERSLLNRVPENWGDLFYLKYLNLSHTGVTVLPESICNLLNLETLDLRQTKVHELPMQIRKLTKLRLLTVYYKYDEGNYSTLNDTTGVKMQVGIGCLTSLQNLYFLEADNDGKDCMQELKKLKKLKKLGIICVQSAQGNALCAAIGAMTVLESLSITAKAEEEILDLGFVLAPRSLRVINIKAKLTRFPDWIPKLRCLVKLVLSFSKFEHDPLDSLKKLPTLFRLNLWDDAFVGDSLHFKGGGFLKLKELDLTRLTNLSSISIDINALANLEDFRCHSNPQLKVLPIDLQNLQKLKNLEFADMPLELVDSIDPNKCGLRHQIINHIPCVRVGEKVESSLPKYEWRSIPTVGNI